MNSSPALTRVLTARCNGPRTARWLRSCGLALCAGTAALSAHAQTPLADEPLFARSNVPGNLALVLSVEFPTAVSVAYTNRNYSTGFEYLGYFDPNKCYMYRASATDTTTAPNVANPDSYFYPVGKASSHACTGQWSGNFLNWASMQTIDPFRWALTGGYRVIDSPALTVVEKAWATGQGGTGNFPDATLSGGALIAGATPFPASTTTLSMRIQGLGNKIRFTTPDTSGAVSFTGKYYNNQTLSGLPALTRTDGAINFNWDSTAPDPSVSRTNMSASWSGSVKAPTSGDYIFRVRADDTVTLSVNGTQVVNQTSYDGLTNHYSPTYTVSAGKMFNIAVQFSQGGGGSSVVLEWLLPGTMTYVPVGGGLASLYGAAVSYDSGTPPAGGVVYEAFVRGKVCDASASAGGIESNCTAYGANYKPEGLMQKYANKIRYSALGYLNDSNILRDGGVLRAQQKFVGPTQPVPGSLPISNPRSEWDASTGVFAPNPDAADAAATAGIMGLPSGASITNSGVINYLNKFGEVTPGSYKTYDNVSELYYAAIRYFKNLPNVPEWTNVPAGTSDATKITWTDGFPVITAPADPILYSCQRNFILGIGDANTHADKNVPGNSITTNEPAMPAAVQANTWVDPTDKTFTIKVNAVDATNKIGVLEGLGSSLGTVNPYNGCCNNNSTLMAGLAYDAHIRDIRGRPITASFPQPQTIDTYWVDVQEYQTYKPNNQFYLATKYGGFTVPGNYSYYNTDPTLLPLSAWSTSGDKDLVSGQPRPDNYYSGGQPDLMKKGLDAAFSQIASAIGRSTTSFSTSLPQVTVAGNASFSSTYTGKDWTGELTANTLSFDATGAPIVPLPENWKFTDKLATQLAGTGWDLNRRVVSWNGSSGVAFRSSGGSQLDSTALGTLDTTYVAGNDSVNYLNYLRGDRSYELGCTVGCGSTTRVYRARTKLLGDIVGSKARPVGPPSFPYSDATNSGYAAFKTKWASRRTVVYVGSNDGMMHAINGALVTAPSPPLESDAAAGTEMFAYVPRALFQGPTAPNTDGLASLGNTAFTHHFMVNATPSVYDVDFARTPGGSGAADWHSVLIGGLGKGGRSYYAMDVTDPQGMVAGGESAVAGKVLWEFSDPSLGYTYGDPVVVKTAKYGWVVIFASGYNNGDGKGYFLFVNPRTGALLEKVSTGAGTLASSAGLAYANAFIVNATDGTADAVYAGDLLGNLWRLDVTASSGSYPAPIKLASLTDAGGSPQPVTSRPSIEVDPNTKKRFVLVGTGRLLDPTDIASTQVQTYYAITDGTNAQFNRTFPLPPPPTLDFPVTRAMLANDTNALVGVGGGKGFDPGTQMGWFEDLGVDSTTGIAWRVTTDSTTLLGSVAFATTLPNGSACSPSGDSRVYGRDFSTGTTTVQSLVGGALTPSLYVSLVGNVTDLRYLSVGGKAALISGTDTGSVSKIDTNPLGSLQLRRLNWRELQGVN